MPPKQQTRVSNDTPTSPKATFRRTSYTLQQKIDILDMYHKRDEIAYAELQKRQINRTTFLTWLRTEDKLRKEAASLDTSTTKRVRRSPLDPVDRALWRWFLEKRATEKDVRLTDSDLLNQAQRFLHNFIEIGMLLPISYTKSRKQSTQITDDSITTDSIATPLLSADSKVRSPTVTYSAIPAVYKGIYNPSNLCYVSVILQTLFMCPQFRQYILYIRPREIRIGTIVLNPYYFLYTQAYQDKLIQRFGLSQYSELTRFVTCIPSFLRYFKKYEDEQLPHPMAVSQSYQSLRYIFSLLASSEEKTPTQTNISPSDESGLELEDKHLDLAASEPQTDTPKPIIESKDQLPQHIHSQQAQHSAQKRTLDPASAELNILLTTPGSPVVCINTRTSVLLSKEDPSSFIFSLSKNFHSIDPIDPTEFLVTYVENNEDLIDLTVQGDAHEFFTSLMDMLSLFFFEECLPNLPRKLFWITYLDQTLCAQNNHVFKAHLDGCFSLSIPIQGFSHLNEVLTALHTGMPCDKQNCRECERAHIIHSDEKVECFSRLSFTQLPNTLFFHLKRFTHDQSLQYPKKDSSPFMFPIETLDLSPYTALKRPAKDTPDEQKFVQYHLFRLVGVICHAGTISTGHYFAFIKERCNAERWLLFNDEGVVPVNIRWMTNIIYGSTQKQKQLPASRSNCCAYILVYERVYPIDEWTFEKELISKFTSESTFKFFSFRDTEDVSLESKITPPEELSVVEVLEESNTDEEQDTDETISFDDEDTSSKDSDHSSSSSSVSSSIHRKPEKTLSTDSSTLMLPNVKEKFSRLFTMNRSKIPRPPAVDRNWIYRWRQRHGIKYTTFLGEGADADVAAGTQWVEQILPQIMRDYKPDNIFNADETGIYYKRLPTKGLILKKEVVRGSKINKSRLTALVGASMTGEKLPLLLIGLHQQKKLIGQLPSSITYTYNSNAWMTRTLFETWLDTLNEQMRTRQRHIALVVDNCSAHHTQREYSNLKLFFLPPCVTATHQPCDAGIIAALKARYRRLFLGLLYRVGLDKPNNLKAISYLQCIQNIHKAWNSIDSDIIVNCFRHAWGDTSIENEELPTKTTESIPTDASDEVDRFVERNLSLLHFRTEDNLVVQPEGEAEIVESIRQENVVASEADSSDVDTPNSDTPTERLKQESSLKAPSMEELQNAASLLLNAIDLGIFANDDVPNLTEVRKAVKTIRNRVGNSRDEGSDSPKRVLQPTLDLFTTLNDDKPKPQLGSASDSV